MLDEAGSLHQTTSLQRPLSTPDPGRWLWPALLALRFKYLGGEAAEPGRSKSILSIYVLHHVHVYLYT